MTTMAPPVADRRHMLCEMNESGDTRILWDEDNEDEVAVAKRAFDDLVGKKKFAAFHVKKNGEQGERMREFDPSAEKIIIVKPLAGG